MSFFGLLGVLFIALKLTSVINWSWWIVLLPIYGGAVIILGIMAIVGLIAVWANS
jgi:hypothetical protein